MQEPDLRFIPETTTALEETSTPLWQLVDVVIRERLLAKFPFNIRAERSGFSEEEIRRWCGNAVRQSMMKTMLGNPRHVNGVTLRKKPDFYFFKQLRLKADKDMAMNVLTLFQNSTGRKRQKLSNGILLFITTFIVSGHGIHFNKATDARKYLSFLELLEIPIQQISVNILLLRTVHRSKSAEARTFGVKLGVTHESINVRGLREREYSSAREIIIQVLNTPVGPVHCKNRVKGSKGFRYAMYMLAIMHDLVE